MTWKCPKCKRETVKIEYPTLFFCPLCDWEQMKLEKTNV